jgi:hypothetical protein
VQHSLHLATGSKFIHVNTLQDGFATQLYTFGKMEGEKKRAGGEVEQ